MTLLLSPQKALIAYSNSPNIFAFECCEYQERCEIPPPEICQQIFNPYLSNLETGEERIVAQKTGIFDPSWLDENKLTYQDPNGEEPPCNRLIIAIP